MLRKVSVLVSIIVISGAAAAQEQTYLREYRYHASDMDSRVTARENTLKLMKAELLEEVASYVKSSSDIVQREENSTFSSDFKHTATVVSAGYVRASVMDERWDGREYWIKAKLFLDPEKVKEALRREVERPIGTPSAEKGQVEQASDPAMAATHGQPYVVPQVITPVARKDFLRALFANAMSLVSPLKFQVLNHYSFSGKWPVTIEELGYSKGQMTDGETIDSVNVEANGVIRVQLTETFGKNKEYLLFPERIMGGTSVKYHCLTNVDLGKDFYSARMCKFVDENRVEVADGNS